MALPIFLSPALIFRQTPNANVFKIFLNIENLVELKGKKAYGIFYRGNYLLGCVLGLEGIKSVKLILKTLLKTCVPHVTRQVYLRAPFCILGESFRDGGGGGVELHRKNLGRPSSTFYVK